MTKQEVYFKKLLEENHDRLYWMIRKIILVHDDTQDVLQNTWIKIHKGLESFKGESQIETWMFRIAYNESMRFLKKKKIVYRIDEVNKDYLGQLISDPYFNANQTAIELQEVLGKLNERERHVFNLKYFDELKFKTIAELIDLNENSVKTLYYRAEKKIKKHFNTEKI